MILGVGLARSQMLRLLASPPTINVLPSGSSFTDLYDVEDKRSISIGNCYSSVQCINQFATEPINPFEHGTLWSEMCSLLRTLLFISLNNYDDKRRGSIERNCKGRPNYFNNIVLT